MASECPWCKEDGVNFGASVCSICHRSVRSELSKSLSNNGCIGTIVTYAIVWAVFAALFRWMGMDSETAVWVSGVLMFFSLFSKAKG